MTNGASLAPRGYSRSGGTHAARGHASRRARAHTRTPILVDARDLATSAVVCAVLATSVPLALLQIPNGAAWLPAGTPDPVGVLRACGVALPAIMVAAPCGAAAVRRAGTGWPVLLAGLLTIALADLTGDAVRTIPLLAADRLLHGIGAGLILPGATALAVGGGLSNGHSHGRGRGAGSPATDSTVTAVACAVVTVASLAAAPTLARDSILTAGTRPGGAWHAMLEPYPWLPVVALLALSAYLPLAGGQALRRRDAAGDRARLAVSAPPFIGLGLMVFAVSYRTHDAVIVTAICEVLVLGILCYRGRGIRLAAAALAGFTLMPFSTILPTFALVVLALVLVLALVPRAAVYHRGPVERAGVVGGDTPVPLQGGVESPVDVLFGVSMMISALGAGYLWMTVHG